jgi:hypothetical protein
MLLCDRVTNTVLLMKLYYVVWHTGAMDRGHAERVAAAAGLRHHITNIFLVVFIANITITQTGAADRGHAEGWQQQLG